MRLLFVIALFVLVASVSSARTSYHQAPKRNMLWKQLDDPVSDDTKIPLLLALKLQNVEKLSNLALSVSDPLSSEYGQYWSLEQIRDLVAPSPEHISIITQYIIQHVGLPLADIEVTYSRDWIKLHNVPIRVAEEILQTQFRHFEHVEDKTRFIRSAGSYSLPAEIAPYIDFVGGVNRLPARPMVRHTEFSVSDGPDYTVTPKFLRDIYNVPDTLRGRNPFNTQAVAEFLGQYYNNSDLQSYFSKYDAPALNVSKLIGPNDESMVGAEAQLDIELIMALAPYVPTEFWSFGGLRNNSEPASRYNQEPFLDWLTALANTRIVPLVHSVSYADDESSIPVDYVKRVDAEFMKCAARGLTILVSAGDDGIGGPDVRTDPAGCVTSQPAYPSCSAWVTAIGGTQLNSDLTAEIVSDTRLGSRITTGGGFSNLFSTPSWQKTQVQAYLSLAKSKNLLPPSNWFNPYGRVYPDISALATNYTIVMAAKDVTIGGTSASAPVIAALISLMNEKRLEAGAPTMGFFNPWLYQITAIHPETVHDVTDGNNACSAYGDKCCVHGFAATAGFDAVSGVGTPNFSALYQYV